ncbi:redox-sensitive bicupin YhaK (pirin superfamily) [Pseudomonas tolaasii]
MTTIPSLSGFRGITHRTHGVKHGPITRLMSPADLGEIVKPFVFLDLFDAKQPAIRKMGDMPIHPHSGLATVTVLTEGRMRYDAPGAGVGTLTYGGVEWLRAGGGVWHGKELTVDNVPHIQGFQLWLALPADLENGEPVSCYIESTDMLQKGPAHVIVGNHECTQSPVPAPAGVNYLLVTLRAGERWTYQPPAGHTVGWLALATGELDAGVVIGAGEMVIFESGEQPITLEAGREGEAVFVLGSAVPHPYSLHLGYYSVHTSAKALEAGESRIAQLGEKLKEAGDRRTATGTVPVFR